MKANEAPEKIYIDNPNYDFWYPIKDENSIEYTRTDAFIEKACEWLRNSGIIRDNSGGYDREFIINKFRKAMNL